MDINYEYYKVFYYVGKYRNITKAAQALGGSQPNVTRVIKLLEGALGCQLLLRSNKGITFTEKGELLYERVSAAFLQIQTAEEELGSSSGQTEGTIVRIYALDKPAKLKKAALILSSGSGNVYDGAIYEYRNSFLDYLKLEDMGIFTAYDKQNKSEEKLAELKAFGKSLV